MGFCSAVTLAFATIFSLVAAALLAIAFSTDNWITITVTRDELKVRKYFGLGQKYLDCICIFVLVTTEEITYEDLKRIFCKF